MGVAFEAAVICGVPLFDPDPDRRSLVRERAEARLFALPKRIRPRGKHVTTSEPTEAYVWIWLPGQREPVSPDVSTLKGP